MKFINNFKTIFLPALFLCLFSPANSSGKILIGAILTGKIPYYMNMHEALATELHEKLPAGEEVEFILQRPFPDPVAWSNAARKLIVGGVDIIVSYGYPATDAALTKRSEVPIVYAGVYDPEVAIKGGNVTGCGYTLSPAKLFEFYRQVVDMKRLCVIYSHNEGDSVSQMKILEELARQENLDLFKMDISAHKDLKMLRQIREGDALYITGSTFAHVWLEKMLTFLQQKKIPVADIFPHTKKKGVLMTFHQDAEQLGRQAAGLVAKVISGEKAQNVQPVVLSDSKLVINLAEAGLLGLDIPGDLQGEAVEIIK